MIGHKPFVIACIPIFVRAAMVCDDGSGDLMGEIVETTCFYEDRLMCFACLDRILSSGREGYLLVVS